MAGVTPDRYIQTRSLSDGTNWQASSHSWGDGQFHLPRLTRLNGPTRPGDIGARSLNQAACSMAAMRRSESAVALLLGAASGLVVGGMIRLATELGLAVVAEFLRNTSGQLLLFEAVIGVITLVLGLVIGWRVVRPFLPDIRALYGVREPPPT